MKTADIKRIDCVIEWNPDAHRYDATVTASIRNGGRRVRSYRIMVPRITAVPEAYGLACDMIGQDTGLRDTEYAARGFGFSRDRIRLTVKPNHR